ncbi:MAG: hypothetical protein ACTTH7_05655 [Treponema sp.]
MKALKKVIGSLEKCYAVSPLRYDGTEYMLIAAEKENECRLYSMDGQHISTVWNAPGGTMSLVPLKYPDGAFLATHRFYSPNNAADAAIVLAVPEKQETALEAVQTCTQQMQSQPDPIRWQVIPVLHLPFLHRFDMLERNGIRYLIMCTIKSQHRYTDDWSSGGKVYAGILPDDLTAEQTGGHTLHIGVLKAGLVKNHGYTKDIHKGIETAVICAENGVFRFTPPETQGGAWTIEQLLDTPASDAIFTDLNGDGEKELLVIAPFHGDTVSIYEYSCGAYRCAYTYPEPVEFAHAITAGTVFGTNYIFIGHRKGAQRLLAFYYDHTLSQYTADVLDEQAGAANACFFDRADNPFLAVTNREQDEIACYTFTQ